ncbi:MAG: hypothetical protein ACTSQD_07210 [Promethearchaeota archaeon]
MPKYKKDKKKPPKSKNISEDVFLLRSVRISAILGGIFLLLSLVFNGTQRFYDHLVTKLLPSISHLLQADNWVVVDNIIKVSVILFAFFFMIISLGNFKEYTGKPIKIQEILILFGFSLIQTVRNLYVFIFTLIGLVLLLFYLYLVQESQY